jgi:hypothetical protein
MLYGSRRPVSEAKRTESAPAQLFKRASSSHYDHLRSAADNRSRRIKILLYEGYKRNVGNTRLCWIYSSFSLPQQLQIRDRSGNLPESSLVIYLEFFSCQMKLHRRIRYIRQQLLVLSDVALHVRRLHAGSATPYLPTRPFQLQCSGNSHNSDQRCWQKG